jgi:hypothetical protein
MMQVEGSLLLYAASCGSMLQAIKMRKGNPLRDARCHRIGQWNLLDGKKWRGQRKERNQKEKKKNKPEEKEHISLSHLGSRSRARSFRLKEKKNRKCPKGRTRRRRRNLKKKYS